MNKNTKPPNTQSESDISDELLNADPTDPIATIDEGLFRKV